MEGEGDGGSADGTSAGVFLGVEIRQDGSSRMLTEISSKLYCVPVSHVTTISV